MSDISHLEKGLNQNSIFVRVSGYIVLSIITFIVYFQILDHYFISYDDYAYVVLNEDVNKGLTWESVINSFVEFKTQLLNYHPLTFISHMIDVELYGLDAGYHHLTSILHHIVNSNLVLYLLFTITRHYWVSFLVAFLFALHPMHVESVAWIAERKDLLSTFFFLIGLIVYHSYVLNKSRLKYISLLLIFTCGLMAKAMIVTFPFVLLLMDYWPLKRIEIKASINFSQVNKLIVEKLPFMLVALVFSIITITMQEGAMASGSQLSLWLRIENAFVSYANYLYQAIYPTNLSIFHPHPGKWSDNVFWSSLFIVAVITVTSLVSIKKTPYLFVGWFFFLGTLLPVIGIIPIGAHAFADRYTYIPYLGLFLILAFGLKEVVDHYPKAKNTTLVMAVCFMLFLTSITLSYLPYWKYDVLLFKKSLAIYDPAYEEILASKSHGEITRQVPTAMTEMYSMMGSALYKIKQYHDAEVHLLEAAQLVPSSWKPYYVLGLVYRDLGNITKSNENFQKAGVRHASIRKDVANQIRINNQTLNNTQNPLKLRQHDRPEHPY